MLATLIPRAFPVLLWRENGQKLCQEILCVKVALLLVLSISYGVLCFQSQVMFADKICEITFS